MYFTFILLADTFIQSDLQCIQVILFLSICVFSGNWTHNIDYSSTFHKEFWRTKQLLVPNIDFHCGERNTIEVNEDPSTVWLIQFKLVLSWYQSLQSSFTENMKFLHYI